MFSCKKKHILDKRYCKNENKPLLSTSDFSLFIPANETYDPHLIYLYYLAKVFTYPIYKGGPLFYLKLILNS